MGKQKKLIQASELTKIKPVLLKNGRADDFIKIQEYLKEFGYLNSEIYEKGILDDLTSVALAKYQKFFNLPHTGIFDVITKDSMTKPRCGLPDNSELDFSITCKWENKTELTYAFGVTTSDISGSTPFQAVRNAFLTWQNCIPLNFREVNSSQSPDIFIEWRASPDSDHNMGATTLAHADYPPKCGFINKTLPRPLHFNENISWCIGTIKDQYDIESVALHEIGHLLGLGHSNDANSIMFATINPNTIKKMSKDDLDGVRSLYGERQPLTSNSFFIHFTDIYVEDDSDNFMAGAGDIFYTFKIDNDVIAFVPPENTRKVDSGNRLPVSGDRLIQKNSDESFSIFGTVKDDDNFLTGDIDDAGYFLNTYSGSNNWWAGATTGSTINVSQRLDNDGLKVVVNYSITWVRSDRIINLNPGDTPPPPPPINIADGGTILYQGADYNSQISGIDGLMLIRPSQFFKIGDFNLPVSTSAQRPTLGGINIQFHMPGLPANSANSIKVGTQIQVTLYDRLISERHLGSSTVIFEDIAFLNSLPYSGTLDNGENGWSNKVVSIKIEHYEVVGPH